MSRNADKEQLDGVSVKLCFRPSTMDRNKERLYYRIIIHRVCYIYNSAYMISSSEWKDASSSRAKRLATIKNRTKWEIHEIMTIAKRIMSECVDVEFKSIVAEFENSKAKQSFTSFCKEQAERLVSTNRVRTSETYLSTYKSFMRFRDDEDIMLYEFDANMIEDYEAFLRGTGVSMNTTSFYLRNLRTLLNKAVKQSLIPSCNFFGDVYTGIPKTAKRAISLDDLRRIKELDLKSYPKLDYARDMFMLSFYFRGMSFIDMAHLHHSDLQNGHVIYHRRKTRQRMDVKWESVMTEILDKYPRDAKYLFPILKCVEKEDRIHFKYISKQVNRWLKKVGKIAEVKLPLTM